MSSAGPVSTPPPGYIDNPDNPEYIGYQLVICSVVTASLSTVFLCLRIYTRKYLVGSVGGDDLWIIFGWISSIAFSISSSVVTKYGMGKHIWDITVDSFETYLKLLLIIGVAYNGALAGVKISICCFYLRLSPDRTFRILVFLMMGITIMYSFAGLMAFMFACNPVAASWDLALAALPSTTCINRPAEYLAQSILNIVTDIGTFLLPLPTIWNLKLPFRQRLGVSSIFTVGLLVCAVTIIRLKVIILVMKSSDTSWDTNGLLIWSTVEVHMAIVCACVATLKPFLKHFFPAILGKGSSDPSGQGYTMQGKSTKLAGGSQRTHSIALQNFYGAEASHQHIATVTSNAGRDPRHRDGDAESQTSIMGEMDRELDAKEGVVVTRTVHIS